MNQNDFRMENIQVIAAADSKIIGQIVTCITYGNVLSYE
jgi:hypothetical protein